MHQREVKPHAIRGGVDIFRGEVQGGGVDGVSDGAGDAVIVGVDKGLVGAEDIAWHLVEKEYQT